jgi:hypothetical protein
VQLAEFSADGRGRWEADDPITTTANNYEPLPIYSLYSVDTLRAFLGTPQKEKGGGEGVAAWIN